MSYICVAENNLPHSLRTQVITRKAKEILSPFYLMILIKLEEFLLTEKTLSLKTLRKSVMLTKKRKSIDITRRKSIDMTIAVSINPHNLKSINIQPHANLRLKEFTNLCPIFHQSNRKPRNIE